MRRAVRLTHLDPVLGGRKTPMMANPAGENGVVTDAQVAAARMAIVAALEASSPRERVYELIHEWHLVVEAQDRQCAGLS